jgi:hypothetical protein
VSNIFYLPRAQSLPGAKLTFSISGTSTLQNTYQDVGLTTPHANPVVADASGYFAPIYLDPSLPNYRMKLTTSADVLIVQYDGIPAAGSTGHDLLLSKAGASLTLEDLAQASGDRRWKIYLSGSSLVVAAADDDGTVTDNAIVITRTSGLVTSMALGSTSTSSFKHRGVVIMPIMAVKAADTSRTSTATLANDSELVVEIPEGGHYQIEALLRFYGGGGGFARAFTYSGTVHADGIGVGGSAHVNGTGSVVAVANATSTVANATITAAAPGDYHNIIGEAHFTTGGTLRIQWAQNSSNASATTLKAGSYLIARKLTAATS